ncbi:conserved hypothetical protein [uncultured Desulfobacterium sp.]|uniref:Uncharacterized protein n=1 Tax=uncultured Desulfobacterium sp. TaxID=201089 RepID=A0A445N205_9BACT|nr:conserved hypothetical protein [uncultured Desulfobacterium sp.]
MNSNYFDQKKNEFLAHIYSANYRDAEDLYKGLAKITFDTREFSELDQKAINQLQQAARRFRTQLAKASPGDFMSTYEKIRKRLAGAVRQETKNVRLVEYDQWAHKIGLTDELTRIMFKTIATLQMSVGCSISCRRCNEWALPGPRKHFSFDAVTRLISKIFSSGNKEFILYCASDPLDWKCGEKDIVDIIRFMAQNGYKPRYGLLTKIPRGSYDVVRRLLALGADIGFSITDKNRLRAERIKNETGAKIEVQHDFDDLLIAAGLDENFTSIKSSITDSYGTEITPEGAFFILPTFTSALYPTGQCRLSVTQDLKFFLKKKTGRDALPVQYFKPLEVVDLDGNEFILDDLMNAQVANILLDNGSDLLTPPGMMNLREYFKTYEHEATMRRKGLLPVIAKGFIKDILLDEEHKEVSTRERYRHFRRMVYDYSRTCRISDVQSLKINAFSFFLKSISKYLKNHPAEAEIVRFLRREDRQRATIGYKELESLSGPFDELIRNRETEIFELFQLLMFKLMEDPDNEQIRRLIMDYPADASDIL